VQQAATGGAGGRDGDVIEREDKEGALSRRVILGGAAAVAASGVSPDPALAGALLSERLERKEFNKPVFNSSRPGNQEQGCTSCMQLTHIA
jgi:hypothetical protein